MILFQDSLNAILRGWDMLVYQATYGDSPVHLLVRAFVIFAVVAAVILTIWKLAKAVKRAIERRKIKDYFIASPFVSRYEFFNMWENVRKSGKRAPHKYNADVSGCYIILLFANEVRDGDYSRYEDVYVGQSLYCAERVRQHMTLSSSKGNALVANALESGRYAYVLIVPCPPSEMNSLERTLIWAFKATKSFNKTRGGSARRNSNDISC